VALAAFISKADKQKRPYKRQRLGFNEDYDDQYDHAQGDDQLFYYEGEGDVEEDQQPPSNGNTTSNGDTTGKEEEEETPVKYWVQRYTLFSLFDKGIKMDRGGSSL